MDQSNRVEKSVSIRTLKKVLISFLVRYNQFSLAHTPQNATSDRKKMRTLVAHDTPEQLRCSNYQNRMINVFSSTS